MKGGRKSPGKMLVAVLGAAFLLFLLLRMFAEGEEVQVGLTPALQAEGAVQRPLEASPEFPLVASPVAATKESAGPDRQALQTHGSIRGRAVLGDAPLKGVTVLLYSGEGYESFSQYRTSSFGYRVLADGPALDRKTLEAARVARGRTDSKGFFEFKGVAPGTYTLDAFCWELMNRWRASEGKPPKEVGLLEAGRHVKRKCEVVVGQELNLGDLEFFKGAERQFLVMRAAAKPTRVLIECGRANLKVRILKEGEQEPVTRGGQTDASGEIEITVPPDTGIRIDLVDSKGKVMGSTDRFVRFPRGLLTELYVPAVPGSLMVHLPLDGELQPGQVIQYTRTRIGSAELDILIKSVDGNKPLRRGPHLGSSKRGIEYPVLRSGHYQVKAMRKVAPEGGGLPVPTGEWMVGEVKVFSGRTTHCYLK